MDYSFDVDDAVDRNSQTGPIETVQLQNFGGNSIENVNEPFFTRKPTDRSGLRSTRSFRRRKQNKANQSKAEEENCKSLAAFGFERSNPHFEVAQLSYEGLLRRVEMLQSQSTVTENGEVAFETKQDADDEDGGQDIQPNFTVPFDTLQPFAVPPTLAKGVHLSVAWHKPERLPMELLVLRPEGIAEVTTRPTADALSIAGCMPAHATASASSLTASQPSLPPLMSRQDKHWRAYLHHPTVQYYVRITEAAQRLRPPALFFHRRSIRLLRVRVAVVGVTEQRGWAGMGADLDLASKVPVDYDAYNDRRDQKAAELKRQAKARMHAHGMSKAASPSGFQPPGARPGSAAPRTTGAGGRLQRLSNQSGHNTSRTSGSSALGHSRMRGGLSRGTARHRYGSDDRPVMSMLRHDSWLWRGMKRLEDERSLVDQRRADRKLLWSRLQKFQHRAGFCGVHTQFTMGNPSLVRQAQQSASLQRVQRQVQQAAQVAAGTAAAASSDEAGPKVVNWSAKAVHRSIKTLEDSRRTRELEEGQRDAEMLTIASSGGVLAASHFNPSQKRNRSRTNSRRDSSVGEQKSGDEATRRERGRSRSHSMASVTSTTAEQEALMGPKWDMTGKLSFISAEDWSTARGMGGGGGRMGGATDRSEGPSNTIVVGGGEHVLKGLMFGSERPEVLQDIQQRVKAKHIQAHILGEFYESSDESEEDTADQSGRNQTRFGGANARGKRSSVGEAKPAKYQPLTASFAGLLSTVEARNPPPHTKSTASLRSRPHSANLARRRRNNRRGMADQPSADAPPPLSEELEEFFEKLSSQRHPDCGPPSRTLSPEALKASVARLTYSHRRPASAAQARRGGNSHRQLEAGGLVVQQHSSAERRVAWMLERAREKREVRDHLALRTALAAEKQAAHLASDAMEVRCVQYIGNVGCRHC